MQSNRNKKSEKPKFVDTKMLIAALAVAVTFGFWNLFSNNAYSAEKSSPSVVVTLPPQPPSVAADNLPPLPTLVPLVDVTIPQVAPASDTLSTQPGNQAPVSDNGIAQPQQTTPLRVVGVPTLVVVQKQKPVFGDQISSASTTDNSSSSSSSSKNGGGSSSKPSTTTKSSKK